MYVRHLMPRVLEALRDRPVVTINGARQTGKTVLAKQMASGAHPAQYFTLDDSGTLALIAQDPYGFVAAQDGPIVIDEVQRLPELFPAIKQRIDERREPGRFLLTGSANVLLLPKIADSLAGRMEIETLWPLSECEIEGVAPAFIQRTFETSFPWSGTFSTRSEIASRMLRGGYPEPLGFTSQRRGAWYESYLTAVLQKDVREMADIEGLSVFPRLLQAIAARTASSLNISDLSRDLGVPWSTLNRYVTLLQASFLSHELPPWSGSQVKRLTRSPKLYVSDTGLLAHLWRVDEKALATDNGTYGRLLEAFVVSELVRQASSLPVAPKLSHFMKHQVGEVDLVIEDHSGQIVGVEVKSGGSLGPHDFKGLRLLADAAGERFVRGIVLYTGERSVNVSAAPVELVAVPVSELWV